MKQILTAIEQHALKTPKAIAVRSNSDSITYEALVAEVRNVTQAVNSRHCQRLGLYMDNGIDWIIADLACAQASVTLVPLPWFFSRQQLQHAITDAQLDGLLIAAGQKMIDLPSTSSLEPLNLRFVLQHFSGLRLVHQNKTNIVKQSYTSGTTGQPKGIPLSGELIDAVAMSLSEMTKPLKVNSHLGLLPYATLLENIGGIYVPLLQGKTVHAESSARLGLNAQLNMEPMQLASLFEELRPESLITTPQLLKLICYLSEIQAIDVSCLKFVAVGGARVGHELLNKAAMQNLPVYEGYGLTEASSVAFLNTPNAQKPGSVGKALPHVSPRIAADGELILSFPRLDLPEVATGDIASIDEDGFVFIDGRKKNLIVLSTGRNVSPEWVEGELNGNDLVMQSFVFGEAQSAVSALIFAPHANDSDLTEIIRDTNEGLPAYAQIQHCYRLQAAFSTDTETLTSNGRLRRELIIQHLDQYTAAGESTAAATTFSH